MSTEEAKSYLAKREIPRLFESLMTGLMYNRPGDHVQYLIDCLVKVKDKGQENITWSSFVDIRRTKTPLPPISSNDKKGHKSKGGSRSGSRNGQRPLSRERSRTPVDELKREITTSPLPPIPIARKDIPECPIVFIMGGPGSGKLTQVQRLISIYEGWVHLSMGDILRAEIAKRGTADEKWEMLTDLISKGEMAPEDMLADVFMEHLKKHKNAKGIIIEGYPRDLRQVEEYDKLVGRVDFVFLLDCDEYYCTQRLLSRGNKNGHLEDNLAAISRRISFFKNNTLPVIKHYDDMGKVVVLDGDRDATEIAFDLSQLFESQFAKHIKKRKDVPPMAKTDNFVDLIPPASVYKARREERNEKPKQETPSNVIPPPTITVKDEGRKSGLPQCPIIFVAGGPGSGKGTQCKMIVDRYKTFVHLSMGDILRTEIATKGTADKKWGMVSSLVQKGEMAPQEMTIDLLYNSLKQYPDAKAFIIEGYPRDKHQVEEFNKHIGGLNLVLLLDCEEYYMQKRLVDRGRNEDRVDDNLNAIANRLNFYKNNTLPILKHYEDNGQLVVLNGDRDAKEIFYDICQLIEFALFGKKTGPEGKADKAISKKPTHINLDDPQTIEAATRIQAGVRGHIVRKEVKPKEVKKESTNIYSKRNAGKNIKKFKPVEEEVIEAAISKEGASRTGDTIANPYHTAKLDEAGNDD
ncbi:hypothetical protein ACJMK2_040003 [Sinanodonta woodiana]|uniref:Adenylate kinase n=1 Tax=Sinanodonta woodiana TaxID=1069815 RepID=A0ABD3WDP3_SINWO